MPIRVLVVDDSVVVRRLVADVLAADPEIEVVATASNGQLALSRLGVTEVDVVTLDIEMPELDGIATLKEIRRTNRRLPVIMFSTLTERGARATLEALASGASDYVTKPANMGSVGESREAVRAQLIPRIKALTGRTLVARPVDPPPRRMPVARGTPRAVVVGCSTGGPEALGTVLAGLPASFPLPILVVQHMPPVFTRLFAERLDRLCPLHVVEAEDRMPVAAGTVYVAPGDRHMRVTVDRQRRHVVAIDDSAPVNYCRPAVDVLFRSAAQAYGNGTIAVVLTGMGADGCAGAAELRSSGSEVLVQDRATSVVWGMPGAVVQHGGADDVLPLPAIAPALLRRANTVPAGMVRGSVA